MLNKEVAYRGLLFIFIFLFLIAFVLYGLLGFNIAYAFFLGAMLRWLPDFLFARWAFKPAKNPSHLVGNFYRAEAVRFIMTLLLFIFVFTWIKSIIAVWLFFGFMSTIIISWVTYYKLSFTR